MALLVSIIIPTCHRNDMLAKCLETLAPGKQTLPFEKYEVIVSDDGTQSNAKEFISQYYPWAKWIKGPMKGPAANRNNGAKHATSEWLVFTDDDCLPASNWLEVYSNAIYSHPEINAFEGAIHPTDEAEMQQEFAECPVNKTGNNFWSANIAVKKELFWKVGGFDEQFFLAAQEDQDIFLRIKELTKVPFLNLSVVYHPVRKLNYFRKFKSIRKEAKNWVFYVVKNRNKNGLKTNTQILKFGYKFHIVSFRDFLFKKHYLRASLSFCWITFGMMCVILYMIKYNNIYEKK